MNMVLLLSNRHRDNKRKELTRVKSHTITHLSVSKLSVKDYGLSSYLQRRKRICVLQQKLLCK